MPGSVRSPASAAIRTPPPSWRGAEAMGIPIYPVHLDDPLFQGFYDGLAAGELRVTADAETGAWHWYPPEVVPGRPDARLEWRDVGSEGSAYSFTTVVRSLLPGDHKDEVPFTVIL